MKKWQLREPLNMDADDWDEIEGHDVEDAIERWADRMDGPNDYFISRAGEASGVDVEVRGDDIEGVARATVYPQFHTTYSAKVKAQ